MDVRREEEKDSKEKTAKEKKSAKSSTFFRVILHLLRQMHFFFKT